MLCTTYVLSISHYSHHKSPSCISAVAFHAQFSWCIQGCWDLPVLFWDLPVLFCSLSCCLTDPDPILALLTPTRARLLPASVVPKTLVCWRSLVHQWSAAVLKTLHVVIIDNAHNDTKWISNELCHAQLGLHTLERAKQAIATVHFYIKLVA